MQRLDVVLLWITSSLWLVLIWRLSGSTNQEVLWLKLGSWALLCYPMNKNIESLIKSLSDWIFCKMTRAKRIVSSKQKSDMVLLCITSSRRQSGSLSLVWCTLLRFGMDEFGLVCLSSVQQQQQQDNQQQEALWLAEFGWVQFGLAEFDLDFKKAGRILVGR